MLPISFIPVIFIYTREKESNPLWEKITHVARLLMDRDMNI